MMTQVCSLARTPTMAHFDAQGDAFMRSFDMVHQTIVFPVQQQSEKGETTWLADLETIAKMASFAARNHRGDPKKLWEKVQPLLVQLQDILEAPQCKLAFGKHEVASMTKCYRELSSSACVFSIAGDSLLQEELNGDARDANLC